MATKAALVGGLVALLLLILTSVSADDDNDGISCTTVVMQLLPCLDYIDGKDSDPSQSCCSGAKSVTGSMKTKQDRQDVCVCIKSALSGKSYDPSRLSGLAKKCGLDTPIPPISTKTNCTTALF